MTTPRTLRKARNRNEARIQRAITGLLIPMLQIPALYRLLENAITNGADDIKLAAIAHTFIYGETRP